jgi:hypothetical protein
MLQKRIKLQLCREATAAFKCPRTATLPSLRFAAGLYVVLFLTTLQDLKIDALEIRLSVFTTNDLDQDLLQIKQV